MDFLRGIPKPGGESVDIYTTCCHRAYGKAGIRNPETETETETETEQEPEPDAELEPKKQKLETFLS